MQTLGNVYRFQCTFIDFEGKRYFENVKVHALNRFQAENELLSLVPVEVRFLREGE